MVLSHFGEAGTCSCVACSMLSSALLFVPEKTTSYVIVAGHWKGYHLFLRGNILLSHFRRAIRHQPRCVVTECDILAD